MTFDDLNSFGAKREPFLFIVDFKAQNIIAYALCELEAKDIEFCIDEEYAVKEHTDFLEKKGADFSEYKKKFDFVIEKIKSGETYLLNLTQPTLIKTPLSLKEIFGCANAHYKLRYKDEFVCFSPEKFIQIEGAKISTFPMKGTIDASMPNAKESILANQKEMAEHIMVVDLLRKHIKKKKKKVRVENFRYVHEIEAGEKKLIHVSS